MIPVRGPDVFRDDGPDPAEDSALAQRLFIKNHLAWLKKYGAGRRRIRLGALATIAQALGVPALKPPPRHAGDAAKQVEKRRIESLQANRVRVPEVLGEGPAALLLADIGKSLSKALTAARRSPERMDALVIEAARSIRDAHDRDLYLGQPVPRNIMVGDGGIGFVDFEEDPGEVMSLADAQARDWLLFVHGISRYYLGDPARFGVVVARCLERERPAVVDRVRDAAARLQMVGTLARPFPGSRPLVTALRALKASFGTGILLTAALAFDFLHDGDFDLLGGMLLRRLLW
jgi:hypothetical protein